MIYFIAWYVIGYVSCLLGDYAIKRNTTLRDLVIYAFLAITGLFMTAFSIIAVVNNRPYFNKTIIKWDRE